MDGIRSHSCIFKILLSPRLLVSCFAVPCSSFAQDISSNYSHYTTSYYHHISAISPFSSTSVISKEKRQRMPDLSVTKQSLLNQKATSKALYKAITKPKKLASQAAAGLAIYGLDYIGVAKPIKEGVDYIKDKTRFNVGECGKVRFGSKLRAETCLFDNSSIELNSDYKMDEVTVNFNWSL